MPKKLIDLNGIAHVWLKIKTLLAGKADTNFGNVTNDDFKQKADEAGVGGTPIIAAASTDGVDYTATVNNLTELKNGFQVIIIPSVTSTVITPTLNINGFGAKNIKQSVSMYTNTGVPAKQAGWMVTNKPIMLMYDGSQWKTVNSRTNAADIYGTVPIASGGTGATTAKDACANLGAVRSVNDIPADANGNVDLTDTVNNLRVLINENTFRNKVLANAFAYIISTLFIEVFSDISDVDSTLGDYSAAINNYFDRENHYFNKTDQGTITIYSKAKTVTSGNNTAWVYGDYTLNGGSIEFAISRDGGTTFTVLTDKALTSISSQPAGSSMIMRVKMTGALIFNNIAWGCK